MRIVFLLERPSQFDAPLFRHAAGDSGHSFEAWFTATDAGGEQPDPELGRSVDWGFDRMRGYAWSQVPGQAQRGWFERRLAGRAVDLLIVNGYRRSAFLRAASTGRRAGVRTALRIDSVQFPGDPGPSLLRRLVVGRLLPARFDRFLTTGSLGESYLGACGVAAGRMGRFPYAVDHAAFSAAAAAGRGRRAELRSAWGIPEGSQVVLALAKLSERELPWDLVEARARLDRPDLHWILAGDGPLRADLEARIAARGLDRIVLPGYVPYPDLPKVYAAADLFVHAAREERWGVSVAEALACGLPVVASDRVGAAADLVAAGENGAVYPVGDAGALAAAIQSALTLDPGRREAASAPLLERFGIESTWKGLVEAAAEEGS